MRVFRDGNKAKLQKLENEVIEEWRNKLFVGIALDLFYENVVDQTKYGILYSLNRLDIIIGNKINYFLLSRTYFVYLMKVPLIHFTINKNKKHIEPIKIYQIGNKLKGNNFGVRPSWIQIYFSSQLVIDCNIRCSVND